MPRTAFGHVDSPGVPAHIKAESFLRLLDMIFQIMDPWGCRSTPQRSKFIKYTIVSQDDTVLLAVYAGTTVNAGH